MDAAEGPRTSLKVFRSFILPKAGGQEGELCAEAIVSRECFELWLKTRKGDVSNPEKAFQKALSAHISGSDGRNPFSRKCFSPVCAQL